VVIEEAEKQDRSCSNMVNLIIREWSFIKKARLKHYDVSKKGKK